ncbi:hypothetical protein GE061_006263 [Apolygus lucorum]|uniref:Cytochrome b-c1 complex subunit 10 n=1 Tax=Apolygus lucorum TaxID=248454 RepID=A0A8S9WXC6_APOLU|nr:hypothetical protein GE061_006263 [Apolygus lucorum]
MPFRINTIMAPKLHTFSSKYLINLARKSYDFVNQRFHPAPAIKQITLSMALKMPDVSKHFGPKRQEIAKKWVPSAALYTASGFLFTCYICDWEAVLKYVPIWNRQYDKKD